MSVIIRGIKMPETCNKCPVQSFQLSISANGFADGYYKCAVLNKSVEDIMYHGRLKNCPLFELKDWKEI